VADASPLRGPAPQDLSAKPFFKDLVEYICSGPVVAMVRLGARARRHTRAAAYAAAYPLTARVSQVWEGPGVVKSARKIIGATNPLEAEPGTIRGDLAVEVGRNVVHGSDSVENGEREIKLWFQGQGVIDWSPTILPWLREM
jgi:nucleoside-diphosphate kinase